MKALTDLRTKLHNLRFKDFSLLAVLFAVLHFLFPHRPVDYVTVVLLLLAVLPWVLPFVKKLRFKSATGGEYEALLDGMGENADEILPQTGPGEQQQPLYLTLAPGNPEGALTLLRHDIETRLKEIARLSDVMDEGRGIAQITRSLERGRAIPRELSFAIRDLSAVLNAATHGEQVDPRAAAWAFEYGSRYVAALDDVVSEIRQQRGPGGDPVDG